jgi:hypothetical protein
MGSPGNTRLLFLVEGMSRQDKKIYMGRFPTDVKEESSWGKLGSEGWSR